MPGRAESRGGVQRGFGTAVRVTSSTSHVCPALGSRSPVFAIYLPLFPFLDYPIWLSSRSLISLSRWGRERERTQETHLIFIRPPPHTVMNQVLRKSQQSLFLLLVRNCLLKLLLCFNDETGVSYRGRIIHYLDLSLKT